MLLFVFFFFKQKTAYEMRISDWSSDVCSSDLLDRVLGQVRHAVHGVVDADAVPVDGGRLRQLVLEVHEDLLALARADRRPGRDAVVEPGARRRLAGWQKLRLAGPGGEEARLGRLREGDRKSTRLNSSH